eukprot:3044236-Rhodomonas_salina.1
MLATSGVIADAPQHQSLLTPSWHSQRTRDSWARGCSEGGRVPGEPNSGCEWAQGGAADDAGGGARVGPGPVEQGELDLDALEQGLWRARLRGGARGG